MYASERSVNPRTERRRRAPAGGGRVSRRHRSTTFTATSSIQAASSCPPIPCRDGAIGRPLRKRHRV